MTLLFVNSNDFMDLKLELYTHESGISVVLNMNPYPHPIPFILRTFGPLIHTQSLYNTYNYIKSSYERVLNI